MRGFDIPREQLEAGWDAYEDQLAKCAQDDHDWRKGEWVEDGGVTCRLHTCRACYAEKLSN
jgi:hypothetical protein